ncbi:PREDICTED: leukotriene B4 receptor 2-like [Cyprinodon variegatus]|uniref:leukotriene B4 receptor 2-like n=1 Tax=Cyprinodon variegatus TaxID=28743 RepID=UPI000742BA6E|nr:PREDICTED: leukotriene B4 receptor 2-like [Cyprinodon variegatus]
MNITTASPFQQTSSSGSTPLPISISARIGIAILILAFVLGFPGNMFVIWSVLCRVKKRSVTCLLVLNLAVADGFVLLSAPLFLRFLAGGKGWEFGSAACKLVHYLSSVNMYVSIYLISLMSMDRWLAVTKPFVSQRMRTKQSLLFLLLGVWVLAFVLSIPMAFYRRCVSKVACLFKSNDSGTSCTPSARPNVTAFAYFSSAVNPILYVFAGSSHIRQAGLSFMGRLFEATNSESRTTSTFTRSGRSGSSPDESSVLHTLSIKIGRPFKGKSNERSCSVAGKEANEPELKTLATVEQVE